MIIAKNYELARKEIEKQAKEGKEIIVLGGDDDFNRKVLENKKVNVLLSPEHAHHKDMLKQRDSGLNHVLCNIAAENGIRIGIDMANLDALQGVEIGKWLARIMQNIKLCRKSKVNMGVFNNKMTFRALRSFLLSVGMSTQQVKEAKVY